MKKRIGPKKVMKTSSDLKTKKKKRTDDKEFVIEGGKKRKTPKLEAEPVSKGESKKMAKMSSQLKNQLAVIGDVGAREVKKLVSENFGEAAPQIVQMLEMNDNDNAVSILQKRLLQSSIAMLVHAESLMTETKGAKGTYQYATLVSQIRELITDIQAARDRSFIANQIIQSIIQPAFLDVAELLMNDHSELRRELMDEELVDEDQQGKLNKIIGVRARGLAQKMQAKYREVEMKLMQQLTS